MRVAAHVKITPTGDTTWVKIVKFIRDLTIRMIDEILDNLWFLPDDASKVAYDFMYKAIYKLLGFQPLPDSGDIEKSKELIRFIAARANIKVDIKE